MLPKVSCIMTTFGRFTCVERSLMMFLLQDYEGRAELIIYNTDVDYPLTVDKTLQAWVDTQQIRIINNNTDAETKLPYTNVGAIRRDAYAYACGESVICWDDDDVFLPWNIRQCVDGMLRNPDAKAWKPKYSLFETPNKLEQAQNTLEASIIVDLQTLRDIGFKMENGSEHLAWYQALSWGGKMVENDETSIPGYSYRWADTGFVAGHKQSGNMGDLSNFENHKLQSKDRAIRPLTLQTDQAILQPYYDYFRGNIDGRTTTPAVTPTFPVNWNVDSINKYVRQYL